MKSAFIPAALLAAFCLSPTVAADEVQVTVTGTIEFNQVGDPPLGNGGSGDPCSMSFLVDSDNFEDSLNFPTRGYIIDESSFVLNWNGSPIALQNPFPGTPYFVLRDNDPAVDGFFLGTNVDVPFGGISLEQVGIFGNFAVNWSQTYTGDTLSSLDILDALGSYDFTNLTVFNWSILDGPFDAAFMIPDKLSIEAAPECYLVLGDAPGAGVFNPGIHSWNTQVGNVQSSYPVLLDDIPEFVIPTLTRPAMAANGTGIAMGQSLPDSQVLQGLFTVQVVMWNPSVFPGQPEQFTYGLLVNVAPNGTVSTRPYGDGTGMEVWAETDTNAAGQPVIRFPFSIPGL